MTEEVLALVDGLLLSDAWIELDRTSEGRLCIEQRIGRESWLHALESELAVAGVETFFHTRKPRTSYFQGKAIRGAGVTSMRTGKYRPFSEQRHRWYPQGKKRVPKDVNLEPRSLAHWYWGDGATSKPGYRMVFHTDGFIEADVKFLQQRLNEKYGWSPALQERRPGQFILVIQRKEDRRDLVSMIKSFCPQCFEYKIIIKE
jgi:hypothetical protein